jgi:O-antigen ligase
MKLDVPRYIPRQLASGERPVGKVLANLRANVLDSIKSWTYILFFVLAWNGYPLAGALTSILTPGTQTITIGFRWLVIALSFLVWVQAILGRQQRLFPPFLMVFFAFCVARMYYDNFVAFIPDADKVGLYFVGTVLPPALVVGICYRNYRKENLPIAIFVLSSIVTVLVTLIEELQLAGAANMSEALGRLFFESLNATLIGNTAVFAIMSGLLIWNRSPLWIRVLIVATSANSVYLLGLAAARGPIVSLVMSFVYLAWIRRSFALLALLAFFVTIPALWLSDGAFQIFDRFITFGVDESSTERIRAMDQSWSSALENPWFGLAYVEPTVMFYPHNLAIESGLAMGIVGFLMMIFMQTRLLLLSSWLGSRGDKMLGILVVSALTGANLSGSIWQSADFWMVATLTLALGSGGAVSSKSRLLNA